MAGISSTETPSLHVAGAGGHAKVVVDAALAADPSRTVFVSDDRASHGRLDVLGIPVSAPLLGTQPCGDGEWHVAIGDNRTRCRVSQQVMAAGRPFASVIHPSANVARQTTIGAGTFVAARAVVAPGASVGRGAIVNHAAVVDHDCRIGDWVHIAAGVVLAGAVTVDEGALIGAGAVVLPGTHVGAWAIVGAGAVVTADVAAGQTVMGVPAKPKGK